MIDDRIPPTTKSNQSVRSKILITALNILEKDGILKLNTNRIAEEAGINISTLYRYFPNKYEIVRILAQDFEDRRTDYIAAYIQKVPQMSNWQLWHEEIIDRLADFRREEPGGVALRQAVMSSPQLRDVDSASTDRAVRLRVHALLARNSQLDEDHAHAVARLVAVTISAILDHAFESTPPDENLIKELKLMANSYLANYLG